MGGDRVFFLLQHSLLLGVYDFLRTFASYNSAHPNLILFSYA